jgi:serine/threonine protein phosphatase 1
MIIIGDVHGCIKTLKTLLTKLPTDDICFVGDLIDRGPKSMEVVEFVRKNNYDCVLGNHENMMINANGSLCFSEIWNNNGGSVTSKNYENCPEKLQEHLEWMKTLPLWKEYPDCKNKKGRFLVVSHSYIGNIWKHRNDRLNVSLNSLEYHILWERPFNLKDTIEIYNVHGHTPRNVPCVKSFYSNIDTGCFYKKRSYINHKTGQTAEKYGVLTALQFPEMKIWQQENLDYE